MGQLIWIKAPPSRFKLRSISRHVNWNMTASAARNHKFLVSKQWEVAGNFARTHCPTAIDDDETRCSLPWPTPYRPRKNPFEQIDNHGGQYLGYLAAREFLPRFSRPSRYVSLYVRYYRIINSGDFSFFFF